MTDDNDDRQNRLLNPARAYAAWGNDAQARLGVIAKRGYKTW